MDRVLPRDVIQYNEDKTMFTCTSDHQGDKHLKQEGDLFLHVPLESAFTNASDKSDSNVTAYFYILELRFHIKFILKTSGVQQCFCYRWHWRTGRAG